ncbi:hypothetical protein GCM10010330_05020 [Streptomyces tendae]|nr:hypothetical protein GCM10010330_05020 [Streptomyces tendae]
MSRAEKPAPTEPSEPEPDLSPYRRAMRDRLLAAPTADADIAGLFGGGTPRPATVGPSDPDERPGGIGARAGS